MRSSILYRAIEQLLLLGRGRLFSLFLKELASTDAPRWSDGNNHRAER